MTASPFLAARLAAMHAVIEQPRLGEHVAALALDSVANGSRGVSEGALRARAATKARQYAAGARAGEVFRPIVSRTRVAFFAVRLVRVSARWLDDDNLASAFKAIRDGVSDALGLNDRDERVRYVVDQAVGPVPAHVRIELYGAPGTRLLALPPARRRAKKPRSTKVKPPPPGVDVAWWQRAVPNLAKHR